MVVLATCFSWELLTWKSTSARFVSVKVKNGTLAGLESVIGCVEKRFLRPI